MFALVLVDVLDDEIYSRVQFISSIAIHRKSLRIFMKSRGTIQYRVALSCSFDVIGQ